MKFKKKIKTISLVGASLLVIEIGASTLLQSKEVFADTTVGTTTLNLSSNSIFNTDVMLRENKNVVHTANPSLMWGPPGGNPFGKFANPGYQSPDFHHRTKKPKKHH